MGNKRIIIDLIFILLILNSCNLESINALNLSDSYYAINVSDIYNFNYYLNYHDIQKGGEFQIQLALPTPIGPISFQYKTTFPVIFKSDNNINVGNNWVNGTIGANSVLKVNHKVDRCLSSNQEIDFEFISPIRTTYLSLTILIMSKGNASCNSFFSNLNSIISNPGLLIGIFGLIILSILTLISIISIAKNIHNPEKSSLISNELYPEK